jgi:hypothetical protein
MMAKITWKRADKESRTGLFPPLRRYVAKIESTGVKLLVQKGPDGDWSAYVYIGCPTKPKELGHMVTGMHGSFSLRRAKLEALRAFKSWSMTVILLAQSDGYGNYTDVRSGKVRQEPLVEIP